MNERATLLPHELDCWIMYSMLKKHGIKPWENTLTNPEEVKYPEDIKAISELDKIVEHKIETERKREKALADLKKVQGGMKHL